jgi:peptidase inhibitor family I36
MVHSVKSSAATLGGVAALAVAASLLAALPANAASSSCSSGDFCIWVNEQYSGSAYKLPGNDDQWSSSSNASYAAWDADSSWKNRYGSWYWACV